MFQKVFKRLLYNKIIHYAGFFTLKIISSTYKIKIINPEIEQNILKRNQVPIYSSWHQRFFPGITFFTTRQPISIMISQSRDGELIAKIADMLGYNPVRGSSSRGGRKALNEICEMAFQGYKIGHIVDGPRGPFGVVKPGLVKIAQYSGMPILPTIISSEKKWIFNSWDRFMVPKPFSRVIVRFGSEIYVPKDLIGSSFEEKRVFIEHSLNKLYHETDCIWADPEKTDRLFET